MQRVTKDKFTFSTLSSKVTTPYVVWGVQFKNSVLKFSRSPTFNVCDCAVSRGDLECAEISLCLTIQNGNLFKFSILAQT